MTVRVERPAARVAELIMDRPEALNALSTGQARALTQACAAVAAEHEVSVLVISSAVERAFCVGADLKERQQLDDEGFRRQRPIFRAAFGSVLGLPMPVIAAVDGFALGGGYEIALSCDLIVAGHGAVIGLPETGIGLVPGGGGTQLLPRRVGSARAADLLFTARRIEASEAYALGLVDRLVEQGQARTTALDLARVIAERSPLALRAAKRALRLGADRDLASALVVEDEAWREVAFSDHRREGIAAFNERRAPDWPALDDQNSDDQNSDDQTSHDQHPPDRSR